MIARFFRHKVWFRAIAQRAWAIPLAFCGAWAAFSSATGFFYSSDARMFDLMSHLRYETGLAHSGRFPEVLVVEIDDRTYRELGKQFPVSRKIYAEFIRKLSAGRPRMIVFDTTFVGSSNVSPAEDRRLEEAIREAGNVILPFYYSVSGSPVIPLERLCRAAQGIGFIDVPLDGDGVVRRVRPFRRERDVDRVLSSALGVRAAAFLKGVNPGRMLLPQLHDETAYLSMNLKPGDVETMSFIDVVEGRIAEDRLENRLVWVGNTSIIYHDFHRTPLGIMPGVYVALNVFISMIDERFLYSVPGFPGFIGTTALGYTAYGVLTHLSFLRGLLVLPVGLCGLLLAGLILFAAGTFAGISGIAALWCVLFIAIHLRRVQQERIRSEKLAAAGLVVAKFSHELKNPLANLVACMKVLREKSREDNSALRYVGMVEGELSRLSDLSRHMLGFFRFGKEPRGFIAVNDLVQQVLDLVEKKCRESGIRVSWIPQEGLRRVAASENQIKQALLNIILNAIEATPRGGDLNVKTQGKDQTVEVIIEDTGCGIEKAHIKKIFDPFFSTKPEGTGLGLAVSFDIIKSHGGRIQIESEQGKGTSVRIVLPC